MAAVFCGHNGIFDRTHARTENRWVTSSLKLVSVKHMQETDTTLRRTDFWWTKRTFPFWMGQMLPSFVVTKSKKAKFVKDRDFLKKFCQLLS